MERKLEIVEFIDKIITKTLEYQNIEKVNFSIEKPKRIELGVLSTNVIMILRKKNIEKEKLEEFIKNLEKELLNSGYVESIEIINGFFNINVSSSYYMKFLNNFIKREDNIIANNFLKEKIRSEKIFHFEFGSINPTGPVHLGHLRSITVAYVLYNLLSNLHCEVYREFFLNDCGFQIQELMTSIYLRWRQQQGDIVSDFPYKGAYIKNFIPENLEKNITLEEFRTNYLERTINALKKNIVLSLEDYGVFYDNLVIESHLQKDKHLVLFVVNALVDKELIAFVPDLEHQEKIDLDTDYEPFKSKVEELPKNTRIVILTKNHGFEKNKVFLKADGHLTYFGSDVLYLFDKVNRGFGNQYCFLGEDHIGHLSMLETLSRILFPEVHFNVKKVGFVKAFDENNELIPMSKRSGKFLSLNTIEEKFGYEFIKVMMISRSMNGELSVHLKSAQEASIKNNPLFYIQYCYARICSVLKKYNEKDENLDPTTLFYTFDSKEEKEIMKHLIWFDYLMSEAARNLEANLIYQYLYDLASYFHCYWSAGKDNASLRFLTEDKMATRARIQILLAVKRIMHFILKNLLQIKPLESMQYNSPQEN